MKFTRIISMILLVLVISACSNQFSSSLKDGRTALKEEHYSVAVSAFKEALIEKTLDEEAKALFVQSEYGQNKQEYKAFDQAISFHLITYLEKMSE